MNAIHALADHNPAIDSALALLAVAGFEFELVDRCPATCRFCDSDVARAA